MKSLSRRSFFKRAAALSVVPLVSANATSIIQTLKFIHVTDSHMDLSDNDSVEAMKLMVSFINEKYKDLDFVLFGGDNFNNNASSDSDALVFKKIADGLHCEYFSVRGNKEASPKNDKKIDRQGFKKLFMEGRGLEISHEDWRLDRNEYVILGLDSCIDGANNGRYSEESLAFAEKALKSGKPTIILNHHPYTNYWGGTEAKDIHKYVLNNTDAVQKRLFGYSNLLLTLSGHKHIDSVSEINGTKTVVTRGFIRPLDLDMYPMRYVELSANKVEEKLIYTT